MNEQELIKTIKILGDYRQAADALTELMFINPSEAKKISINILEKEFGDVFFQASAFDTLYELSLESAFNYLKLKGVNIDNYILKTVISQITVDSAIIDDTPVIEDMVTFVKEILNLKEDFR